MTLNPVALLGVSYPKIRQWAKMNLQVKSMGHPSGRIETIDPPYYFVVYEKNQLMSMYISGFIITDPETSREVIDWAIRQCR